MGLQRQTPGRVRLAVGDAGFCIALGFGAVHGLQEPMGESEPFELRRIEALLRVDELQFVARALLELGSGLGADANLVNRIGDGQRSVCLQRDGKALRVQRADQRFVDLQHRLPAGEHDEIWAGAAGGLGACRR